MAVIAPDQTAQDQSSWLDEFLAGWQTGTGEMHSVREPATGKHLLDIQMSTPDDVARAAAAAKAAQPAWAAASYQERSGVLRRAA